MKLRYILLYLFLLVNSLLFSQNSEIGFFGGTSYYIGELNPTIQIINKVNPTIGIFYRKNLNLRYALRIGVNYGKLAATDKFNLNELSKFRKLSFTSDIIEGNILLEFNFLPYQINNRRTSHYSPFVFIGFAIFSVNPEVKNETENAIRAAENTISPSIPFGVGVKFNLAQNFGFSLEWGMRKSFTDEIDGLPETYRSGYQLSNSNNNDWYSFLGITLSYKFLTDNDHCRGVVN